LSRRTGEGGVVDVAAVAARLGRIDDGLAGTRDGTAAAEGTSAVLGEAVLIAVGTAQRARLAPRAIRVDGALFAFEQLAALIGRISRAIAGASAIGARGAAHFSDRGAIRHAAAPHAVRRGLADRRIAARVRPAAIRADRRERVAALGGLVATVGALEDTVEHFAITIALDATLPVGAAQAGGAAGIRATHGGAAVHRATDALTRAAFTSGRTRRTEG
jgi:hypothetical protein